MKQFSKFIIFQFPLRLKQLLQQTQLLPLVAQISDKSINIFEHLELVHRSERIQVRKYSHYNQHMIFTVNNVFLYGQKCQNSRKLKLRVKESHSNRFNILQYIHAHINRFGILFFEKIKLTSNYKVTITQAIN